MPDETAPETATSPAPYHEPTARVLDDREHVRTRPGMYVGGLNERGFHHLLWEIVDNSLREAAAGFGTTIGITIHSDGACTVVDDGRGIPITVLPAKGVSTAELIFTTLGGAGDVHGDAGDRYGFGAGSSGVGAAVVNYLSDRLDVEICRDGRAWHMRFEQGVRTRPIAVVGRSGRTGTRVTFRPDRTLFNGLAFDRPRIARRLRELAALHAGVRFRFEDDRVGAREEFHSPEGPADLVRHLAAEWPAVSDVVAFRRTDVRARLSVHGAIQYVARAGRSVTSFVNDWETTAGTHVAGLHAGVGETFGRWADGAGLPLDARAFRLGALWRGLTAVTAVWLPEPSYARCTRDELTNPQVRAFVATAVADSLGHHLRRHPAQARAVVAVTGLSVRDMSLSDLG